MRRITILLAALAALMLVPAASAFAAPSVNVSIEGTGTGEISSVGGVYIPALEKFTTAKEGSPPIECTYASPGPAEGTCNNTATYASGSEGVAMTAYPAEGSEILAWQVSFEGEPSGSTTSGCSEPGPLPKQCQVSWSGEGVEGVTANVTALICLEGEEAVEGECQPPAPSVNVSIEGTGSGEISSVGGVYIPALEKFTTAKEGSPPIECTYASPGPAEGTCNDRATYASGSEGVAMTAYPAEGSEILAWQVSFEGEPSGSATSGCNEPGPLPKQCQVSWSGEEVGGVSANVTALICLEGEEAVEGECQVPPPTQPLTLLINEGEGTVVSNPAGLTCTGSEGESCEAEFEEGAEVTLTASPAAGYRFNYWGSCPSPNGRKCTVTMSEAKEVKAFFVKVWKLTVSKTAGSLPGLVAMNPPGDACLYNCQSVSYSYKTGAEVVLTGNDFGNKHLVEFTGGTGSAAACDGETECTVTIGEEDSSIEALFGLNAKAKLSVEKAGGGTASIRAVGGFKCRSTCGSASAEYFENLSEEITIYWELEPGTSSIDWGSGGGTCTGVKTTNGNCKVTMNEDHELVATLE